MSLLTIVQDTLNEIGSTEIPASIVGSSNQTAAQSLALVNRSLKEVAKRTNWQPLSRTETITTIASQAEYLLPSDFKSVVNQTMWDTTQRRRTIGAITPKDWAFFQSFSTTDTIQLFFRIFRGSEPTSSITASTISFTDDNPDTLEDSANGFLNAGFQVGDRITVSGASTSSNNGTYTIESVIAAKIEVTGSGNFTIEAAGATVSVTTGNGQKVQFYPTPGSAVTITYEYISRALTETIGGTLQGEKYLADTDVSLLDEDTIALGFKWRFLKSKGFPYSEEFRDYELAIAYQAASTGSQVIDMGSGDLNNQRVLVIPDGGFGS